MRNATMLLFFAVWWLVCWGSLCLLLASCTAAPSQAPAPPTSSARAHGAPLAAYRGQTGTVFAVAWSPDGTRLASGGNDSTTQVDMTQFSGDNRKQPDSC